jgi:tRNA U34 2-thiouridine synthase MnmA/TrmU
MALTPAVIVDRSSGEELGHTESAELMTVGQRRGVLPDRDGERRFVSRVDLANHRVEVGRLEDILIESIALDASSLTFSHADLVDGTKVLAQWSAHGTPQMATLRHSDRWWLDLLAPARPVAAGQSVVFYRVNDPAIVEGAAIVAPS